MLTPQTEEGVTIAPKVAAAEARIDWTKPGNDVRAHIRGMSPFPGAWFELDGQRSRCCNALAADGAGAPGDVLDDELMVACGHGRRTAYALAEGGQGADDGGGVPARSADRKAGRLS